MHRVITPLVPQQSARLAKKAHNQTSVVVATQNLLICKVSLLEAQNQIETTDFDQYMQLFAEGLIEAQAQMTGELFMNHVPVPDLADIDETYEV
jgi:hypothetical protein